MQSGTKQRAIVFLLAVAFASGVVRAQAPRGGERSTSVPAAVYSRLFREVVNFEAKADRLAAQGRSDAAVRHHHQIWLGLATEQEAELKQVAADWARQNASLDVQASSARSTLQRLRRESSGAVPSQEVGLAAIAAQEVALAQSARDSLASAFGLGRFAYFESVLRRYASTAVQSTASPRDSLDCAAPCQWPTGESSSYVDAEDCHPGGYCAAFKATLSPAAATTSDGVRLSAYNARQVTENANMTPDTCYFTGSKYLQINASTITKTADVGYDGAYFDYVGNPDSGWVNYYQWAMYIGQAPYDICGQGAAQTIQINGCTTEPPQTYVPAPGQYLWYTLTWNAVLGNRAEAGGAAK